MKPYMAFSRGGGTEYGAILVWAENLKQAKDLAWPDCSSTVCDGDYIDMAVKWLKNRPWLSRDMLSDKPHVNDSPTSCKWCELWGNHLDDSGICDDCRNDERLNRELDEKLGLMVVSDKE